MMYVGYWRAWIAFCWKQLYWRYFSFYFRCFLRLRKSWNFYLYVEHTCCMILLFLIISKEEIIKINKKHNLSTLATPFTIGLCLQSFSDTWNYRKYVSSSHGYVCLLRINKCLLPVIIAERKMNIKRIAQSKILVEAADKKKYFLMKMLMVEAIRHKLEIQQPKIFPTEMRAIRIIPFQVF